VKQTDLVEQQAGDLAALESLPTEALKRELSESLRLTAAHLRRLATIVRILESRGEDLSDLKVGFVHYLRRIAYGQILPEVVVRFGDRPALIRRISQLPLPDQQRLSDGERIEMIDLAKPSEHLMVDPLELLPSQLPIVFSRDAIRPLSEQRLVLASRGREGESKTPTRGDCRPDAARGGIVVRRTFVPLGDVLEALAALKGAELTIEPDEEFSVVPIRLAESEHRALKVLAAQSDCTMGDLIRRALAAYGMIGAKTKEDL